jgi:hypothetical protein
LLRSSQKISALTNPLLHCSLRSPSSQFGAAIAETLRDLSSVSTTIQQTPTGQLQVDINESEVRIDKKHITRDTTKANVKRNRWVIASKSRVGVIHGHRVLIIRSSLRARLRGAPLN